MPESKRTQNELNVMTQNWFLSLSLCLSLSDSVLAYVFAYVLRKLFVFAFRICVKCIHTNARAWQLFCILLLRAIKFTQLNWSANSRNSLTYERSKKKVRIPIHIILVFFFFCLLFIYRHTKRCAIEILVKNSWVNAIVWWRNWLESERKKNWKKKVSIESYEKDRIDIQVNYVFELHPCPHATKWIELNLETDTTGQSRDIHKRIEERKIEEKKFPYRWWVVYARNSSLHVTLIFIFDAEIQALNVLRDRRVLMCACCEYMYSCCNMVISVLRSVVRFPLVQVQPVCH